MGSGGKLYKIRQQQLRLVLPKNKSLPRSIQDNTGGNQPNYTERCGYSIGAAIDIAKIELRSLRLWFRWWRKISKFHLSVKFESPLKHSSMAPARNNYMLSSFVLSIA